MGVKHNQHHVRNILPWVLQAKLGFAVSVKGQEKTAFVDAEAALSEDINFVENADDTVDIKLLKPVLKVPSMKRFTKLEDAQVNYLTKALYLESEAKQDVITKQLLEVLDSKDLDEEKFLVALLKLATKAETLILTNDLAEANKQIATLKEQTIAMREVLALAVIAVINFKSKPVRRLDPMDGSLGGYFTEFAVPAGLEVHCVVINDNGLLVPFDAYTYVESGGICTISFEDDVLNDVSNLHKTISFRKKKMN
jgi:hypothetical protein